MEESLSMEEMSKELPIWKIEGIGVATVSASMKSSSLCCAVLPLMIWPASSKASPPKSKSTNWKKERVIEVLEVLRMVICSAKAALLDPGALPRRVKSVSNSSPLPSVKSEPKASSRLSANGFVFWVKLPTLLRLKESIRSSRVSVERRK